MACSVTLWLIYMLFPGQVAALFTTDEALLSACTASIRIAFCTNFVIGMQMVNQHMFIAMGNAKYSLIFGLMRKIFVLVPLVLVFPFFMGVMGVFLAEPVSNVITVIVTYIVFTKYINGLERAKA